MKSNSKRRLFYFSLCANDQVQLLQTSVSTKQHLCIFISLISFNFIYFNLKANLKAVVGGQEVSTVVSTSELSITEGLVTLYLPLFCIKYKDYFNVWIKIVEYQSQEKYLIFRHENPKKWTMRLFFLLLISHEFAINFSIAF